MGVRLPTFMKSAHLLQGYTQPRESRPANTARAPVCQMTDLYRYSRGKEWFDVA